MFSLFIEKVLEIQRDSKSPFSQGLLTAWHVTMAGLSRGLKVPPVNQAAVFDAWSQVWTPGALACSGSLMAGRDWQLHRSSASPQGEEEAVGR